jgi:hypothetical protein
MAYVWPLIESIWHYDKAFSPKYVTHFADVADVACTYKASANASSCQG